MKMNWPEAFVAAVLIVCVFGFFAAPIVLSYLGFGCK
jgi:hypothetical protein